MVPTLMADRSDKILSFTSLLTFWTNTNLTGELDELKLDADSLESQM